MTIFGLNAHVDRECDEYMRSTVCNTLYSFILLVKKEVVNKKNRKKIKKNTLFTLLFNNST